MNGRRITLRLGGWFAFVFVCASAALAAAAQQPAITSIRLEGSNVVITAQVPAGLKRATLECRERLGQGNWVPAAVAHSDGAGGTVTFRLPLSSQVEILRVRGDATDPLPSSFYTDATSFLEESGGAGVPGDPRFATTLDGTTPVTTESTSAPREVVESDIWRIRGQRLYFFNQYRGLQIIDITNPDAAAVRGTLPLPAAGEQMYLVGDDHAVLLARDGCTWSVTGTESQALIVDVQNDAPRVVASLPVKGSIQESRLVGTALYVASQTYREVAGSAGTTWEWGTLVSAFDLADPASPVVRNTLWYPGYGNVVAATDVFLFVVTQTLEDWWRSVVNCIDITAPDSTMNRYASITTAGRVADKFKLNLSGFVFTAISEVNSGGMLATKLETFRLPHPASLGPLGVVKLGELAFARGERLFASRFDGDKAYIVTFGTRILIDPLWVLDLSNPAQPRITAELVVPGFSTFLFPLGNRLVAIGVETNQASVSLFDVADPARPALLSRVLLGQRFSWSEAVSNEKAFQLLPEAGLILVPFSGSSSDGYVQAVQLVQLTSDSLRARGVIEHAFQPRRATLYGNRILSISGRELLSVDPADLDSPQVRGTLALGWAVDRLFLHGDFLLELATSDWQAESPILRVGLADAPDAVQGQLALPNVGILGATKRGNHLYVAQGNTEWFYPPPLESGGVMPPPTNLTTLVLTVINLSNLPQLSIAGQTRTQSSSISWLDSLQAVWPKADTLVWAGGGVNYWWWYEPWYPIGPIVVRPAIGAIFWPPFWGGGGHLIAFDVADPAAPKFASAINLQGTNGWWNFSKAFAAEGLVYLSHQQSEFLIVPFAADATTDPASVPSGAAADTTVVDPTVVYPVPTGRWFSRSFLDVVDYADPEHPTVRKPVNIPGRLHGVSHNGALLYTVGTRAHRDPNTSPSWTEYLSASAYDGVSAHRIDSIALSDAWPHPVVVVGNNVFVGRSGYSTTTTDVGPHLVETWTLPDSGRFTRSGRVELPMPASVLVHLPGMIAAQQTDNTLTLLDLADPTNLRVIGRGRPPGCVWFNMDNADGEAGRGLWLPLGFYGVATIRASNE
jgi:hypothetical protein